MDLYSLSLEIKSIVKDVYPDILVTHTCDSKGTARFLFEKGYINDYSSLKKTLSDEWFKLKGCIVDGSGMNDDVPNQNWWILDIQGSSESPIPLNVIGALNPTESSFNFSNQILIILLVCLLAIVMTFINFAKIPILQSPMGVNETKV